MKTKLTALVLALALVGCSSTKQAASIEGGQITAINAQKLTTNFKRKGVKLEWECAWGTGAFGLTNSMCVKGDIKAIEVTSYATSNGNSENNRRTALIRASDRARASVRHFIQEEVSSTRVTNTLAKNVEKASDRMKSRTTTGEVVSMSDSDAEKDTNHSIRENSNDTAYQLSENIRVNAQGILRGFKVIKQEVVGSQEVAVTIRWDKESEKVSNQLRKKFVN